MAEEIKQIRIKTSALFRLKKQYLNYDAEVNAMKTKINDLPSVTEDDKVTLKKQNEFLAESESVKSNVKQKLIDSYEDLELYVKQKQHIADVESSAEKAKAVQTLKEVETFLEDMQ